MKKCAYCFKRIWGSMITHNNESYHPECAEKALKYLEKQNNRCTS